MAAEPPWPAPRRRSRGLQRFDLSRRGGVRLRRSGFWDGAGGVFVTMATGAVVVALLVGWVLVWANDEGGPNALWLTLGSVAFSAILTSLVTLNMNLRASHRLRQAEAAFLTGASHNLRTPLAAIRAATATLRDVRRLSPDDRDRLLDAVAHETARLELRIDNLLETARLDLEPLPFSDARVDLGGLVTSVLEDARWAVAAVGGGSTIEVEAPVWVAGDERALRLMLENLVDNAIKYASGAPRIDAAVVARGGFALVTITDAGVGFEADDRELFARFVRGDTGRPGTGLGLALSRAIARGHGGDLRLTSPGPGLGAVAEAWLPLIAPPP